MFIYKIVNLKNSKVYIGQTRAKRASARFSYHKWHLRNNKHHNSHLQSDWSEYGEDAFSFLVVCSAESLEELDVLEKDEILKVESYNSERGYNKQYGGRVSPQLCADVKDRISKARLGYKASDETKRRMSLARKGVPGKIPSEETRRKMSAAAKGRILGPPSEETRRKISERHKGRVSCRKGVILSEETRRKMSESQLRRKNNKSGGIQCTH